MNILIPQTSAVDNTVFPLAWLIHANPDAANDVSDGYTVKAMMTVVQDEIADGTMGSCVWDPTAKQGVCHLVTVAGGYATGAQMVGIDQNMIKNKISNPGNPGTAIEATVNWDSLAGPAEEAPVEEEAEEDYGEEDAETDDAF